MQTIQPNSDFVYVISGKVDRKTREYRGGRSSIDHSEITVYYHWEARGCGYVG